jgi:transposase
MSYRRYNREFKQEACGLVVAGGYTPAAAARQLGMVEMTLRGWLKKRNWKGGRSMPDPRPAPESNDPKVLKTRIRELERQLRRAEMEREILKKATAFFASPHLPGSTGSNDTERSST